MAEVVKLRADCGDGAEPSTELIEVVEDLLRRARAGDIQAICYATVRGNGNVSTGWHGADLGHTHKMAAGISFLEHRFHAECPIHEDVPEFPKEK